MRRARLLAREPPCGAAPGSCSLKSAGRLRVVVADRSIELQRFQYATARIRFERANSPRLDQATVTEAALNELESCWNDRTAKLQVIPGKEALSMFNQHLQNEYGVSVTPTAIVDAMRVDEIPNEMRTLLEDVSRFAQSNVE